MWTRKELKDRAKQRFKVNYWKCVLVALLMALLGGGAGMGAGSGGSYTEVRDAVNKVFDARDKGFSHYAGIGSDIFDYNGIDGDIYDEIDDGIYDYDEAEEDDTDADLDTFFDDAAGGNPVETAITVTAIFFIVILILLIALVVIMIIVIPLEVFIINPLEVGIKHFFVQNLRENANIREICYAFDHNYINSVKTLFFRDLYVFLWSLLFIIPGIIKSYEYRMVPYILGDNPDIGREQAFALSNVMMQGSKWKAFVLDLSFLGWYILNGLTLGVLGIFYVNPYVNQTNAALYQKLKGLQAMQEPAGMAYQA